MRFTSGFTLAELVIAVGIIGIVSGIAVPSYKAYIDESNTAVAVADIAVLQNRIATYASQRKFWAFPATLADIGGAPLDPWGNAYEYLNIENGNPNRGSVRKDRNLVPINSDYDLYSMGPDGRSRKPLTAAHSRDDIVRANNGAFIGVAEEY